MSIKILLLLAALGGGVLPSFAFAQQSPTSTWGSSLTWRSGFDRSLDLQRAEAQERARSGGYGPALVITNYNGEVTNNTEQTYNGSVSTASSTNAVNLNTNSNSVTNSNGTVGVTFTNGSTSYQATQTAQAHNTNVGPAGTATTGANASTTGGRP